MPAESEALIQAEILRSIGSRPDVRLWRANCGSARDTRTGRLIRFGTPGQADLSGIWYAPIRCRGCGHVHYTGRRLEIEVKAARGTQTPAQRRFQIMVERMGGVYVLARSVADVLAVLEDDPLTALRAASGERP